MSCSSTETAEAGSVTITDATPEVLRSEMVRALDGYQAALADYARLVAEARAAAEAVLEAQKRVRQCERLAYWATRAMFPDMRKVVIRKKSLKPTGPRLLGTRVPGSIPDRLLKVFEAHPGRTFRIKELAGAIGMDPREISGTLSRLARDVSGRVVAPARGRYRYSPAEENNT